MLELKKLSVTLTGILLVVYMFCLKLAVLCPKNGQILWTFAQIMSVTLKYKASQ